MSETKDNNAPLENSADSEQDHNLDETTNLFAHFLSIRATEGVSPDARPGREKEFEFHFQEVFDRVQKDLLDDTQVDDDKPWIMGDFKVLKKIGSGGMANVYEADQLSLNRRVALKVLSTHRSFTAGAVEKFRREAMAGGRQSHPGIVAIYAVGQDRGHHYIAQELVEGGTTLAEWLKWLRQRKDLPSGYFLETARLAIEAAEALQYAHSTGVIHRDIKPSNLLLTRRGRIKVSDFGLAKIEDELALTRTGDMAGSPYYMSPEQAGADKKKVGRRTDIYSLGVTLYEMLTLNRPFEGDTSHEVMKKVLSMDPKDPRILESRVPADLAVICMKALEKKTEDRYESMEAFADDLRRFLSGDVILAKQVGPMRRFWKKTLRSPMLCITYAAAIIAVLLLIYIPWTFAQMASERNLAREAQQEAEDNAEIADERYEEILRLADTKRIANLRKEADALWPSTEDNAPALQTWCDDADEILARRPSHQAMFNILDAQLKTQEEGSTTRVNPDDNSLVWQHDTLHELLTDIDAVCSPLSEIRKSVETRLAHSRSVRSITLERQAKNWADTINAIADKNRNPIYNGLRIKPQSGLIPIGRDADSGLFEFAHVETGKIPERDSDGKIIYDVDCGLVFVLIPPGSFDMGAVKPDDTRKLGDPNVNPYANSKQQPIHRVTINAFFMSKYEVSQSQWVRMTNDNPSQYKDGTFCGIEADLLHAVEYVDFHDCVQWTSRLELRLPSEAEWEYAARAGTTTIWWTGNDVASLAGAANVADEYYELNGGEEGWTYEAFNDGYGKASPVSMYRPNPFGLHNVNGNVWEWCQDMYSKNYKDTPRDGSPCVSKKGGWRVGRGGGWDAAAAACSSTNRIGLKPEDRGGYLGLRPARDIKQ